MFSQTIKFQIPAATAKTAGNPVAHCTLDVEGLP